MFCYTLIEPLNNKKKSPKVQIKLPMGPHLTHRSLSRRQIRNYLIKGLTGFSAFLVGVHVFGLCATALITDIIQLSTGYQTPYFLTVCKPNYTSLNVSCSENSYVVEDICSGSDPTVINNGRLDTKDPLKMC